MDPLAYFNTVRETFLQAEGAAGGPVSRSFSVAGSPIRLRFAGPALIPRIVPAMIHLQVPDNNPPDLEVCLWDSLSTGTRMPPPAWKVETRKPRGEIPGYNDGRVHTAFHQGTNSLSMLDRDSRLALFWVRDAAKVPYYETAAPIRTILHWWMSLLGKQLVHGGAVGTGERAVLFAGQGGSGKSTSALACLESDLLFLGDDYVVVSMSPSATVHSLYGMAKLNEDQLARFPGLVPLIDNLDRVGEEKALIRLGDRYPSRLARQLPLKAILVPEITHRPHTSYRRESPATGLSALAPTTLVQLPSASIGAFRTMASLARTVPTFVLELGEDVSQVPTVIRELLGAL